jgi:hypothetical protein
MLAVLLSLGKHAGSCQFDAQRRLNALCGRRSFAFRQTFDFKQEMP